jgi:outer membrane murein-binding lipoprotein Lpp
MKKIVVLPCILVGFLLTGCSVEFDTVSSKAEKFESKTEEFADKAENLGSEFEAALEEGKQLEKKEKLTSEDQKRIVTLIDDLSAVIEEFKGEKAPMFNWLKDVSVEKLLEREKMLLEIQERAKDSKATIEDVKEMNKALSDEIEINLFGK